MPIFWFVNFSSPYFLENVVNLLTPAGYVMHQQFNIQQLFALLTPYLCVLYLSCNKQRLVPLTTEIDFYNLYEKRLQRSKDWGCNSYPANVENIVSS
jgi:hypothetical protein